MDWLWQNPVARMYGPLFLVLYACVSAVTILACRVLVRRLDWTGRLPPPPVPAAPDPYEIAYMRGGENEVARAAVFALVKRGLLGFSRDGKKFLVERTAAQPPRDYLTQIERRVYDWFDRPRESGEVFKSGGLADRLKGLCAAYEQALRRDHLLTPPDVSSRVALARAAGFAVIAGLGAYKLAAALAQGRTNIVFLVALGVASVFVLFAATRAPRMSLRGRRHLERLRVAFDRLKDGGGANTSGHMADYADATRELLWKDGGSPAVARAVDPSLVALGVFGAAALASSDYENYKAAFGRASSDAGGSSSSCGSGCGSSDSSSGGDGGGGGCGGGCGGCGGSD